MSEKAKSLYIILHDDWSTFHNKGRVTIQTLEHRKKNITQALNFIGSQHTIVECFAPTPNQEIAHIINLEPSMIYMRGDDWKDFPGKEALIANNIPIEYVSYTKKISTTKIRESL